MKYPKTILQKLISNLGFSQSKTNDPSEESVKTSTEISSTQNSTELKNPDTNENTIPKVSRKLGPSYTDGQGGATGGADW